MKKIHHLILFTVFCIGLISCRGGSGSSSKIAKDITDGSGGDGSATCTASPLKVRIGDTLDWFSRDQIDDYNQRLNSTAVGRLRLPAKRSACTGFFINENTILTNNHCVANESHLRGAVFSVTGTDGIKVDYNCKQFIKTNRNLDVTAIECEGTPGKSLGYLYLETSRPERYSEIYVIQENCNYIDDPYCRADRYISYGDIISINSSRVTHLADTLGGSSGSPIISMDSHKVVALHNAGSSSGLNGARNFGILMSRVTDFLKNTVPEVTFYEDLDASQIRDDRDNSDGGDNNNVVCD